MKAIKENWKLVLIVAAGIAKSKEEKDNVEKGLN